MYSKLLSGLDTSATDIYTYCLDNELYILYYQGTNSQVPPLVSDFCFALEPVSGRLLFCMQQNNIQHIPSLNGTE